MSRKLGGLILVLLLGDAACYQSADRAARIAAPEMQDKALVTSTLQRDESTKMAETGAAPSSPAPDKSTPAQPVAVPVQRKIIRSGQMNLEVAAVDKAGEAVKAFVASIGGYTADESQSQNPYSVRQMSITCRIPAEKLEAALAKFKEIGKLESLSISANDITEQYFNLEIRIRNQKRLEAELLELLSRPTNKLADLLEVEREVARVRGEIDEMEGRKRFWDNQVEFSTIVVSMHEPRPAIAGGEGGAFRKLLRAFREAGENFVDAVAAIIAASGALIPVAAVLAAVGWLIGKLWRRRKRARPPEPPRP
ncbi:MAG: DUF4349 domain-containing protein [Acidobacteriota bacterium]